jgi:hypothetical protein
MIESGPIPAVHGVVRWRLIDLAQWIYGGPIGFRLAVAHPDRVQALIIQNAVAHEEGLGPL